MTKSEAKAGSGHLRAILAILPTMAVDARSDEAATLRQLVGALSTSAEQDVREARFGAALHACFEAARLAGATFSAMGRVERYVAGATFVGNASIAVAVASLRLAAIQQARIVAATSFRSRGEVEACQAALNASFDAIVEYAADMADQDVYRLLTALHAAVTRDLQQRSRPLPRMVAYSFGAAMPSLALANRLYGDGERADELRDENRVPHPLFMPPAGRALSA